MSSASISSSLVRVCLPSSEAVFGSHQITSWLGSLRRGEPRKLDVTGAELLTEARGEMG